MNSKYILKVTTSLLVFFIFLFPYSASAREDIVEVSKVVKIVDPALFFIMTSTGTGSGFLYKDNKTVITNRHVVDDVPLYSKIQLKSVVHQATGFTDLGEAFSGKLVFKHPDLDIAIIKLPVALSASPLIGDIEASKGYLPRGTKILAHGFPSTYSPLVTSGLISGHYRDALSTEVYYLTDTALASGSSGGPVTDFDGELIGIATLIHVDETEIGYGWGYVIPLHRMNAAIDQDGNSCEEAIDKFIRKIRAEHNQKKRLNLILASYQELTQKCGSPIELAECTIEYLDRVKRLAQITNIEDSVDAYDSGINITKYYNERFVRLGLRDGFDYSVEEHAQFEAVTIAMKEWVGSLTARADFLNEREAERIALAIFDHTIDTIDEYKLLLNRTCNSFDNIDYSDATWMRELNQSDLIKAMVANAVLTYLEAAALQLIDLAQSDDMPESIHLKSAELIEVVLSIWGAGSDKCYELIEFIIGDSTEIDPVDFYITVIQTAQDDGFEILVGGEDEVEAQSNMWYTIEEAPYNRTLRIVAVSNSSEDIDLFVYDEENSLLFSDDELDNYPVIECVVPANAKYSIQLINNAVTNCVYDITWLAKRAF
jgi:hypothetical protein